MEEKNEIKQNRNEFIYLLMLTGFTCNNNCIFCSVKDKCFNKDKLTKDIFRDLSEGREKGYRNVEFTGGEPAIRKDIVDLITFAKEIGYEDIAITTNGRIFSYEKFVKEIIKAGLNKVTFSLHGASDSTHNSVTRTPGSYKNIIDGIKNVKKFSSVHINVSTVVSKLNYKELEKIGKLVLSFNIKRWFLLDLIPDGNAKLFYKNLVVRLNDLEKEINKLKNIASNFNAIGFFDFPLCLFKEKFRKMTNLMLMNAKMRMDTVFQVGYNSKRISEDKKGKYEDMYRQNIAICMKCKYNDECGGVWTKYLELFGEKETISLAKKNKCI